VVLAATLSAGCASFRDCSEEDASGAAALPELLSQTGLYADIAGQVFADDAFEFAPQFPLWTDGATKRRWILLPDAAQIDTTDPEDWVFPVGTKFFKEFTRDGVRVETRLNEKTDSGWSAVTYLWNAAGTDADRQLDELPDASGTPHDIPSAAQCLTCHGGRSDFTLGFSATQLDLATRQQLFAMGALTAPVETELSLDPVEREGLGVLHGNCAHCHNSDRALQPQATTCYAPDPEDTFDVTLPSDLSSLDDAPAVETARFLLGSPDDSEVLHRMSQRNLSEKNPSMPPLGTELVDDEGLAAVEALVAILPPGRSGDR